MLSEIKMPARGGKPRNIKQYNRRLVLSAMSFDNPCSAGEISKIIGLSKTTISKLFSELTTTGLLCLMGKGSSTFEGGKRPDLYRLNADYRHVIVIQLSEPLYVECSVMNLNCQIRCVKRRVTPPTISYHDAILIAGELVCEILRESGLGKENICAVALSCEGIVDSKSGIIRKPAHHSWTCNLPVVEDIAEILALNATISMDNVCRYGGFAELLYRENAELSSLIVIWNDDLVGGCILVDRKLIQGSYGLSGEFGHMIMEPTSERQCSCGGYGCFESMVSRRYLLERAFSSWFEFEGSSISTKACDKSLTPDDIFTAANCGDPFARNLLDPIIRYYAILIRNISAIHEAQKIIIQGCYASAGNYFYSNLRKLVIENSIHSVDNGVKIEPSKFKDNIPRTLGAGFHAITLFLNSEDLQGLIEKGRE